VWLRIARISWLAVVALQQAAGNAEQVVVVRLDQSRVDLVAGDLVKRPIVDLRE
jgi:hypothetical protein